MMKILVPLDGSALAEVALTPALTLLAQAAPPRELVVSRVVADTLTIPDVAAADVALDITEQAQAYLRAVPFPQEAITVTRKVGLGHAASVIALQATEEQADLIVLSTHGRSGVARVILGSVAEAVVQQAAIPVLLVRAEQPTAFTRGGTPLQVLVPLDGTPAAEAIFPALRAMFHGWPMDLTLLTFVAPAAPATAVDDARIALTADAVRLQAQAPEAHMTREVLVGDPATAIPRYCQQHPPDMIALTHRHQRGVHHLLPLGGTFAACVAHTNAPILVQRVPRDHPAHEA